MKIYKWMQENMRIFDYVLKKKAMDALGGEVKYNNSVKNIYEMLCDTKHDYDKYFQDGDFVKGLNKQLVKNDRKRKILAVADMATFASVMFLYYANVQYFPDVELQNTLKIISGATTLSTLVADGITMVDYFKSRFAFAKIVRDYTKKSDLTDPNSKKEVELTKDYCIVNAAEDYYNYYNG